MKYAEFRRTVLKHLCEYKQTALPDCAAGLWRGQAYNHILKKRKDNLLPGVNAPAIHWHPDAAHLNSSQMMCVNFFSILMAAADRQNILLQTLATANGWPLAGCGIKTYEFEHTHDETERTNFDFFLRLDDGAQIFFEIKYTENGFGGRSAATPDRWEKQAAYDNGDTYQQRLSKIDPELNEESFYSDYQIWRNISYRQRPNDYVCFIYPKENGALEEKAIVFAQKKIDRVAFLPWKDLHNEVCNQNPDSACRKALEGFYAKYLDY